MEKLSVLAPAGLDHCIPLAKTSRDRIIQNNMKLPEHTVNPSSLLKKRNDPVPLDEWFAIRIESAIELERLENGSKTRWG